MTGGPGDEHPNATPASSAGREVFDDLRADRRVFLEELLALLEDVEIYQPLHAIDHAALGIAEAKRACADRNGRIAGFLGDVTGLRVLDVGASLGYFSLALAAKGAEVRAIDYDARNIEVARHLARMHDVGGVHFEVATFDEAFVTALPAGAHDCALVLSVVHHQYATKGIDGAHALIRALLQKVPLVIVELAHGGEAHDCEWVAAAPLDPLGELLAAGDLSHERLGDHATHLSASTRPLVALWETGTFVVNDHSYPCTESLVKSHGGASVAWRRRFAVNDAVFVKQYDFDAPSSVREHNRRQLINEIACYNLLDDVRADHPTDALLRMIDWEVGRQSGAIVLDRAHGRRLDEPGERFTAASAAEVLGRVVDALAYLRDNLGLYHNDVRPWNVMHGPGGVRLIDLGLASPISTGVLTDDLRSLLQSMSGPEPADDDREGFASLHRAAGSGGLDEVRAALSALRVS